MTTLRLPIGISDFKELVEGDYLFVDKTLLIKEIIDDGAKVIVFPRPRRFGKTLNMSMLRHFFDVNNHGSDLFKGLHITQQGDAYMKHCGQSPVIYFSLKNVKKETFEAAYQLICALMAKVYGEHEDLLASVALNQYEKTIFQSILDETAKESHLDQSLQFLSDCLYRHYGKKPYIIIDEYDAPIISAVKYGYQEKMLSLMRNFLGSGLKDNTSLQKGILTGIMRISKESIFSGINNLQVYGFLSHHYGEHFGFLEEQVKDLLVRSKGNEQTIQKIKDWYNGYVIAGEVLYNPWSIISYIKENYLLKPYWVNTSDNYFIEKTFSEAPLSIKKYFEYLMQGQSIVRQIREDLTLQDLERFGEQALWSLLCLSGYLKIVTVEYDDLGRAHCELAIPNREILSLYTEFIERWFSNTLNIDAYHGFLKSLVEGDVVTFHVYLQRYLQESSSYFDVNQKEPESVYHSFVLGLIVGLRGEYSVTSNRESGFGRYDVMLIPKDKNKRGIIIEFKTAKSDDESVLKETAQAALQQIIDKQYSETLEQVGVKTILQLGLAFAGKCVTYATTH